MKKTSENLILFQQLLHKDKFKYIFIYGDEVVVEELKKEYQVLIL